MTQLVSVLVLHTRSCRFESYFGHQPTKKGKQMSEKIYCADIRYSATKVKLQITELRIVEETPTRVIVQSKNGFEFMISRKRLDIIGEPYCTTRENALASIKYRLEYDLEEKKKLIQSYQEVLYDLEKEM